MKKYLLLFLTVVAFSCCDNSDKKETPSGNLRTPQINEILESGSSFTGALVVYACDITTSAYFGNYTSMPDELKILPATYIFGKNNYIKATPPVLLPIGAYSLMYWGVPSSNTPTYDRPASYEPAIRFGAIMKDAVISLRATSSSSDVYYPVYDYVFARQDIYIGKDDMSADLMRATGGVIINMTSSNSLPFDDAVDNVYVEIGPIAKNINFFTAEPSDFTASVRIPLTISTDRMSISNNMAMLFPSGETLPSITIKITLTSGDVKSYTRALTNAIEAANIVTINVSVGDILTTPGDGGFDVEGWTETKESISI